MTYDLFYVAPVESKQYILKNGILVPNEVNKLIKSGDLPREVLGVSYGMDSSNFPDYVSLLEDFSSCNWVAEAICESRTGSFKDLDFRAMGYYIDSKIRDHSEFVNAEKVKEMNPDSYYSEVLYKGNIPLELIKEYFFVYTL